MTFEIMTLFPDLIETVLQSSILGIAQKNNAICVKTHQIRNYSMDKHHRVDDTPYGGGMGMLLRPEPVVDCYRSILKSLPQTEKRRTIYLSPQGPVLTQKKATELAEYDRLILLCGHYEGIDQRALDSIVDEEISIGNYILTGGELPACVLIDCIARLKEGVLADPLCHKEESLCYGGLLEYPQYTQPLSYEGMEVPAVLRSGNHKKIAQWRLEQSRRKTKKKRPDLL